MGWSFNDWKGILLQELQSTIRSSHVEYCWRKICMSQNFMVWIFLHIVAGDWRWYGKIWRIKILRVWLFYIAVCQSSWMDWRIKILNGWIFSFAVCQSSWMVFKWGRSKFQFELLVVMENVSCVVPMIYCLRSDSKIVPAQDVVKWVFYIDKCDSNSNFIFDFFYRLWVYSKSLCKEEA